MELKNIDVGTAAKVGGALSLVVGLIIGIFAAVISLVVPGSGSSWPMFSGFAAIIVLPIVYGIFGLIGYAIIAALYNFVVRFTGGFVVTFAEEKKPE